MKTLLGQRVVVIGDAILRFADGRVRKLSVREIEVSNGNTTSLEEPEGEKPSTGKELLDALEASGFIGLWKDRDDIKDKYARELRVLAEKRSGH